MPSTVTPQRCEICGKETTQRCSACATTGVDLFFCSKEHQKLVWRAHKRNCGPDKANPFFIPPLTDEELASLNERAHLPVMTTTLVPSTISYDLAKVSGHSFEYVLEHIGGPVFDMQHLPTKAHLVGMAAGLLPNDLAKAPWFTPLHHKLLFVASLTTQIFFGEGDAWVCDGMGTSDPRFRSILARVTFDVFEGSVPMDKLDR